MGLYLVFVFLRLRRVDQHADQSPTLVEYIVLGSEVADDFEGYGNVPPDGYGPLYGQMASTTKMKVEYVRHYVPAPGAL